MSTIWIKQGLILSMNEGESVYEGHIVIEDDRIAYVGADEPTGYTFDETINGRGKVYMPGLVNTHNHAAMSLLRGYADDLNLQVWLEEKMWPNEAKFTASDVRFGTLLSIAEMIRSGTTSFVDMYDQMDQVAQAVEETGIRGCLTRGIIGFGPDEVVQDKLKEAVRFAKDWHGKANGRITTMLAPHSPYTCSPSFIEQVVEQSILLDLPMHTHMSETAKEVQQNVDDYGVRPVEHLQKLGVFDRPCIVAHGVHLTDEEIDILAAHDVRVSHNAGSNLRLASGIARVPEMLKKGVLVSLGTDSSASNNNLDMFEEIRLAALLHKGVSGDPTAVPATTALKMGTLDGARSIWLNDVGCLKKGMKAVIISVDLEQPHFVPKTDIVSHLVYASSGHDVRDVWVDGKQLMKDRQLLTMDEEKIRFEAQKCFDGIMSR